MKKILIVGSGILTQNDAAGITLRSIFDGIDANYLMGITWGNTDHSAQKSPIKTINMSYSALSAGQILDHSCFKSVSRKMKKAEVSTSACKEHHYEHSALRSAIKNIRQWVALLPASSNIKISKKVLADIKDFFPQVIYTVGETVTALRLAYQLSTMLKIPIVIHFMDNWKHSIEWASNPLLKSYQKRLSKYCDLCYSRTTECIAIGDKMAETYEKESGVKHSVVMNSIDTKAFRCEPKSQDETTHFLYAGGLHLGRDQMLHDIGVCIDRACAETGHRAEFSIYTSVDNITFFENRFKDLKHTKLIPAVPHDQVCELYKSADVLVHAESSTLDNNDFFKYSVSTKISEYLATGRPFLFWGPKDIYLFDFLRENNLAYTASCIEEAQEIICSMMCECKNKYSDNAVWYAADNFDIAVARERFHQVIDRVCVGKER